MDIKTLEECKVANGTVAKYVRIHWIIPSHRDPHCSSTRFPFNDDVPY